MQRVVDASVVAKWFLPEAHKDQAEKLVRDFIDEKIELIAPDLLIAEVGNLLWKRSVKRKDISLVQASQMYESFLAIGLRLRSSRSIAPAALKLATEKNHPVYDMLYIALAEENGCESVTADETLVRKFRGAFTSFLWLGDL